ncbi:phospho-N-acetylmuramoyl-pentapeptide-transferase [Aureococcus anophagefferens]|nr:phospho-N-acetylmuramoyl-pentapeptide-transferase [Aureococcus anophagefferens]
MQGVRATSSGGARRCGRRAGAESAERQLAGTVSLATASLAATLVVARHCTPRVDDDGVRRRRAQKKWRCDVAASSIFAAGQGRPCRSSWRRCLAGAAATLTICIPGELRRVVLRSCAISAAAYGATRHLLPVIGAKVPAAKYGCDLLKRPAREPIGAADKTVPESLGLVSGVCFVLALVVTQSFQKEQSPEYSAAMLSVVFAVLLGFADDVLDLEWKYKYVLPPLMSLPLLSAYGGGTTVAPPRVLRELLVYMVLLAVFCTNAINIYAGVNGLEAGQTYATGVAILIMSAVELGRAVGDDGVFDEAENAMARHHLFSVTLMLPFCATTLALLKSNWFPAEVFVGDTFTNYAGMTLAVVAILGHFPVMLMALMVPQLLNFLISVPQLFKLRPCPRHRLPTFDEATGYLRFSRVNDRATTVPDGANIMNLTLINAALRACRGLTEPALAALLLALQAATCAAVALRFCLVGGLLTEFC